MATPPLTNEQLQAAVDALHKFKYQHEAAQALGLNSNTYRNRLSQAVHKGFVPSAEVESVRAPTGVDIKISPTNATSIETKIINRLKKGNTTVEELKTLADLGESAIRGIIEDLKHTGFIIHEMGNMFSIEKSMPFPSHHTETSNIIELVSRPDNTFLVGATGDQHLGSKYYRDDVLNDLYDRFEKEKVQCVYNTGNWIEGEARFNKPDILVHGMEAQCRFLSKNYPKRGNIKTYAVSGDDHEGWYGQREGVDIGKFAERIMREEGRDDWVNLGFMESFVRLVNYNTGKYSILSVVHPGGGSSYALSYAIQKIIESLDGGEKPAVGFYGHYHKLWAGNIRGVWCLQTGTCKSQDPFMRKKKLEAHVGGAIVEMEQDPKTGAIIAFKPNMIRYFNKGYYQDRWSQSQGVTHGGMTP
jgi:hypothetical protein